MDHAYESHGSSFANKEGTEHASGNHDTLDHDDIAARTRDQQEGTRSSTKRNKKDPARYIWHFKRFEVDHNLCAMKVGTDALLLGGYATTFFEDNNATNKSSHLPSNPSCSSSYSSSASASEDWPRSILDIGCGSGVIGLMATQKYGEQKRERRLQQQQQQQLDNNNNNNSNLFVIHAVDIDANAVKQAHINYANYPAELISDIIYEIFHTPIQQYNPQDTTKYDLILSAPPYFIPPLGKMQNKITEGRQKARHSNTQSLLMDDLCAAVARMLNPEVGWFFTILSYPKPCDQLEEAAAKYGLECVDVVNVFDCPETAPKIIRRMYAFRHKRKQQQQQQQQQHAASPLSTPPPAAAAALPEPREFFIYRGKHNNIGVRPFSEQYERMLRDFLPPNK